MLITAVNKTGILSQVDMNVIFANISMLDLEGGDDIVGSYEGSDGL